MSLAPELLDQLSDIDAQDLEDFYWTLPRASRDLIDRLPMAERDATMRIAFLTRDDVADSAAQTHLASEEIGIYAFGRDRFYIPEGRTTISLFPHQRAILEFMFDPANRFQTMVYSTVKKSGKTAVASLVARWIAETWGPHVEVYCLANDYEQAKGRIYDKIVKSIELTPGYKTQKRLLTTPDGGNRWHVVEREARFLPTLSTVRAVSGDYKGEAGSNPTATFWSELWAYTSEATTRLWDELTPVPTRDRSIRFVETYAGYENESTLLLDLYKMGTRQGDRLTKDELPGWPFKDRPPVYVNQKARLVMYWDDGEIARRMPWQSKEYYEAQEATLRQEAFLRLHKNFWTSSVETFLQKEWWVRCKGTVPPLDKHTPVVLGVDLAVTSDCSAVVAVSRDPNAKKNVMKRAHRLWVPPKGGSIRLEDVKDYIKWFCDNYNVVQVAYDPYQAAKLAQELGEEDIAWARKFDQGSTREIADMTLYTMIRDRRLTHDDDEHSEMTQHILNAGSKMSKEADTRLRIIKKAADLKIDLTIALSMATSECLRLLLD